MTLLAEYREARRGEELARLRRVIALRAMLADGMSQQAVADELGVSQPAISQQLHSAPDLGRRDAATALAGQPVAHSRRVAGQQVAGHPVEVTRFSGVGVSQLG